MIQGKTILVTGGTGSFGTTFLDRILQEDVRAVRVYSRDELKQHELRQRIDDQRVRFLLGDVRDLDRLTHATRGVDVLIHAAALKQVPSCEYNPTEAIATNVDGAINVMNAAIANEVPKTIALSSDKAVAPNTLYGASKLCAERIFIAANNYAHSRFSIVRYGNVEGSRGSVIPLFRKQAEARVCHECNGEGEITRNPGYPDPQTEVSDTCRICLGSGVLPGEITITDPAMTRFFLSQSRMVEFVLESLERMQGGEIFVPKMPARKIADLAEEIAPGVPHKIIGIRPGEKVHEVLITQDEARYTREFPDHFSIHPTIRYWDAAYPEGEELPPFFRYASDTESHQSDSIRQALPG